MDHADRGELVFRKKYAIIDMGPIKANLEKSRDGRDARPSGRKVAGLNCYEASDGGRLKLTK